MQTRKKIFSYFLLASYLLVALHHSVSVYQLSEFDQPANTVFHQHEGFQTTHHENHFHIGILHFLGHLFENTNHLNELANEHMLVSQNKPTEKIFHFIQPNNFHFNLNNLVVASVDAESLPDPPYYLSLLQQSKQPNTPLRAPPAII